MFDLISIFLKQQAIQCVMVVPSNHHIQPPKAKLTPKHLLKEISYLCEKPLRKSMGKKLVCFILPKKFP
jgi:hypothetical protein